jgi:hypothetical protein
MLTRLHGLTTACLAALYAVVGLTGSSLYYLTTDVVGNSSNSLSDETVVYFHTHGPGQEGHFHRHNIHRHLSVATTRHHAPQGNHEAAIALDGNTHRPHSCAILSLVSTLKLGHAARSPNLIILDSLVIPIWESGTICARDVVRYSYARGPPAGSFT